jgi:hypothetical protein
MIFNTHSELSGKHAAFSASKPHWLNDNDQQIVNRYDNLRAAQRGTELHALAHEAIRLGIKLGGSNKTLQLYVRDALGYKMRCEQMLYYSDNFFGTADTISFRNRTLRIHDLKTGWRIATEHQLEVYAALFCLEYKVKPFDITIELRIYQNGEVRVYDADPDVITHIMDKIMTFDKIITLRRLEGLS